MNSKDFFKTLNNMGSNRWEPPSYWLFDKENDKINVKDRRL